MYTRGLKLLINLKVIIYTFISSTHPEPFENRLSLNTNYY